ncbi:MAG TPA: VanZ family protein [Chitinophagaceae bacterium]|nr:VanZ family protein [Chitinophagaceae bacterium]
MNTTLKKLIVILPVMIVSLFYFRVLYHESYSGASFKRVAGLVLSILLLFGWIVFVTIRRKQNNFLQVTVQASFFIYVFAVLQLTGYFILFKEISSHDWWDKMNHRIDTHDHVNLEPFKTIGIYQTLGKQILGNFVMLLPLGIYLPLLYARLRKAYSFFAVLLICLVSVAIELLQLATSYHSADIDDVILNTLGGGTGFIIYQLIKTIISSKKIY